MNLRASTIVELLVTMAVTGIVFLIITEGLAMFARLQSQRHETMENEGRTDRGIRRLERLAASADSIGRNGDDIALYDNGTEAHLVSADGALIYRRAEFADTLLADVGAVQIREGAADTLAVELHIDGRSITLRFVSGKASYRTYDKRIAEIENEDDDEKT